MAYIQGEGRSQGSLFPVVLDDLIPVDHMCRVIDAFVARLSLSELGFERAQAAETGRPGYDPRDLLKLYLYGNLNQIRSSRRLEAECRRNVELMWLLGRLYPDHKSISEFRRMHSEAVTAAGTALIRFARSCGLIGVTTPNVKNRTLTGNAALQRTPVLNSQLNPRSAHRRRSLHTDCDR
jgi:transposase